MGILDALFGSGTRCKELLEDGAVIIDVRSPGESQSGHAKGSRNIPLDRLEQQIETIKHYKKPVVLCCASGARSGRAAGILKNHGVECCNAGSWHAINA